jgi:hypothetical protein
VIALVGDAGGFSQFHTIRTAAASTMASHFRDRGGLGKVLLGSRPQLGQTVAPISISPPHQ